MLQALTIALLSLAAGDPQAPAGDTQSPPAATETQTPAQDQQTATQATPTATNEDNVVHCHTVRATGTLIGRRVCSTAAADRARAAHDRQEIEDLQMRNSTIPTPEQRSGG